MAGENPIELVLQIDPGEGADDNEMDDLARQLLGELRDLSAVEDAQLARGGAAPAGAKSGEVITAGAIIVAVLPPLVSKLIDFIQAWSLRGQGRTVKFKGVIDGHVVEFEGPPDHLKKVLASLPISGSPPAETPA
jgi:hypothetical protein